jgi:signal transduction histidine kinase
VLDRVRRRAWGLSERLIASYILVTLAVRHGNTRRLAVSLARHDGHVELAVRDTGTGFDPAAPHPGTGLGHIRDRAAELGGTLDIDSAPGPGTTLTIRIPLP